MGSLIGNAVTLCGDKVQVVFMADEFEDGALPPIVSINMQMDGGSGEYVPLKATTASVGFLVDDLQVLKICSLDYPVAVSIDNHATNKTLFRGYIVPNSYNQQLTGVNDEVTVECVDCLGWAKYVTYRKSASSAVVTLKDVFARACTELGIAEVRIANHVGLRAVGGYELANYELLTLSENTFLHDIYPYYDGSGNLEYGPVERTWEEVLKMIAESLRLTWVQVGGVVYLVDEVEIAATPAYYRNYRGFASEEGVAHEIVEGDFASSACNVSTLPRCSQVVLVHEQREAEKVLPELFYRGGMTPTGDSIEYLTTEDGYVARRKVYTPIYDTTNTYLYAYKKYDDPDNRPIYDDSWEFYQRIGPIYNGLPEEYTILQARALYRGAVAPTVESRIRLNISIGKGEPWNKEDFKYEEDILYLRLSATREGVKRYYNAQTKSWNDELVDNRLIFDISGENYHFDRVIGNEIVVGEGGTIDAEIIVKNDAWSYFLHIKDFSIEVVAPPLEKRKKNELKGTWELRRTQEVTLPIDIATGGWGNLIDDRWYTEIIVGGKSVVDRVWAQANLGDRLMFQAPLRDEANALSPLDAFTCAQLWSGRKVVDGYTRDVLENTITLTLI